MTTEPVPQLVAHRGDMQQYPENSWPALRAAVEAGACWLEFDVQMCADGSFVLLPHSEHCVLISFNDEALQFASRHASLELGWVIHRYDDLHKQRAEQLNPHYLICNQQKIPSHKALWAGAWRWMLYDIRDPQQAIEWAQQGIDLIETGDIIRLLKHPLLARRGCRHGL